jgi:DNA-binding NtrC family response regulator/tetratricopeptide (TPR) repeat protein
MPSEVELGDLCLAVGNLSDALAYYRAALTSAGAEGIRAEVVLKISACLRRQGKAQEALELVDSGISSFQGRGRRDLLAEQATLLCLLGKYGQAQRVCEDAMKEEPAPERGRDAGMYLVLGHVLSRLCKWRQAIVCLEQAATFARMSGDQTALGNALNNLGIVYKNLCRLGDSARCLKRAVRVARRNRDDASLAVRLLNLAVTLSKVGDIGAAQGAVAECIKISSLLGLKRTHALASICGARLARALGDLERAGQLLEDVIAAAASLDEPRVGLLARESLGEVLGDKGDLVRARQVLEQCLAEARGSSRDIEAEAGSRLAYVWHASGGLERAKRHAQQAMAVARSIGDLYEVGRCLRVMALAEPSAARSRACLARAETIFKRMGARLEYGLTLQARASVVRPGTLMELDTLERAAAVFGLCGAGRARVAALCAASEICATLRRHERALALLREAEAVSVRTDEMRKMIWAARSKVDQRLSELLACRSARCEVSPREGLDSLRARFGVACFVVCQPAENAPAEVLSAEGVDLETASVLAGLAAQAGPEAVVVTNLVDALPGLSPRANLGSLLGVALSEGASRVVCMACWRAGEGPGGAGFEAARLVEVYHEMTGLRPRLERPAPVSPTPVAICLGGLLTQDARLKATLLSLVRIARTRANVLVVGETGTGKDLVARAIHCLSPRRDRSLVVQNCAALPEHLLESELFGHRAGAFTDARSDKRGLLETAAGGTFFLDEIGDVTPAIQAKMLRAIESGEIRRLGETQARAIDVRFVSATNKRLEEEIEKGRFRRDLYYRLNVVSVVLPPLRERRQDVPLLTRLFLRRFTRESGRDRIDIDEGALRALTAYSWPGNVRQLENELERAVALLGPREAVTIDVLSPCIAGTTPEARWSLREEIRSVERSRILAVLQTCNWNKTHAARILGDVSRPALVAKMKRLGIPLTRQPV